jgi:hypothetical protein
MFMNELQKKLAPNYVRNIIALMGAVFSSVLRQPDSPIAVNPVLEAEDIPPLVTSAHKKLHMGDIWGLQVDSTPPSVGRSAHGDPVAFG